MVCSKNQRKNSLTDMINKQPLIYFLIRTDTTLALRQKAKKRYHCSTLCLYRFPCCGFSYQRTIEYTKVCDYIFSLSMFSKFIQLVTCISTFFLLRQNDIPSYGLCIHSSLTDIWIISTFLLLRIMLL